ncbi:hypothetical protein [Polaribacter sp.]|uniref:hypothetical protein n=1 Tax=Polaribacter sp. TaxID=1920175 RepID=UPI003F6D55D8
MNKKLKAFFLASSVVLLGYGIYSLEPFKDMDNSRAYSFMAFGFVALILSLIKEKEK